MTHRATGYVDGRIRFIQDHRFRIETGTGQSLLFALAHDAPVELGDLEKFRAGEVWVVVRYSGEPSTESAVAHDVSPSAEGRPPSEER